MNLAKPIRGFLLGAGTVLIAAGASAGVDLPTSFVPRCQPQELRSQPGMSDPCREEYAILGLSGPTVLTDPATDVEATGSIESSSANGGKRTD